MPDAIVPIALQIPIFTIRNVEWEGNVFSGVCLLFCSGVGFRCDHYKDLFKFDHLDPSDSFKLVQLVTLTHMGTSGPSYYLHWHPLAQAPLPDLLQLVNCVAHTSTGKRLAFNWKTFLSYRPFLPLKMTLTICIPCAISDQQHSFHDILFSRK